MKFIFKTIIAIAALLIIGILVASLTGNGYLIKGVQLTYLKGNMSANIYDGADFDTRTVQASKNPYIIPTSTTQIAIPNTLNQEFIANGTVGTMLIVNDSIKWQKYYDKHNQTALSNSFSSVKTMICFLVQIAIQEGKIPSWNTPVKTYLPWLTGPFADSLTLKHLGAMSSGLDWNEHYTDPFCITAKAYYGANIEELMKTLPIKDKPGVNWIYQSGNTQLLGLVLKAVYKLDISTLFSQKLWQPIGAQSSAQWNLDSKEGTELTYCCLNATVADFAKMGLLTLHQGKVNGKQLIDTSYFSKATTGQYSPIYGIGYWLTTIKGHKCILFQGHLGQFIATIPDKNLVFVRVGHRTEGPGPIRQCIQSYLNQILEII